MVCPEANGLMRPHQDPHSGTPAFKRLPVLMRAEDGGDRGVSPPP